MESLARFLSQEIKEKFKISEESRTVLQADIEKAIAFALKFDKFKPKKRVIKNKKPKKIKKRRPLLCSNLY
jgi:hypothetical protein